MPPKRAPKTPIFQGCCFTFAGTFSGYNQDELKNLVTAANAGATVSSNVVYGTTHLVATQTEYNKSSSKVVKAMGNKIPVVSLEFVTDSLDKKKRLKEADYALTSASVVAPLPTPVTTAPASPQPAPAAAPATLPAKGKGGKRKAQDTDDGDDNEDKDKNDKAKKVKTTSSSNKAIKVPQTSSHSGLQHSHQVYVDEEVAWYARLNQTEITSNKNKFYMVQLLKHNTRTEYAVFTHWGRVGESGQKATNQFGDNLEAAKAFFDKKFRDKSSNRWADRDNFVKRPGKYFLLPPDDGDDDEEEKEGKASASNKGKAKVEEIKIPESKLHPKVQDLVSMIFNTSMMLNQMKELDYDADKMPLGKLAKATIHQGYGVLKKIAEEIDNKEFAFRDQHRLAALSSEFYTVIPHSFGRRTPPVINTSEALKRKLEMLESLSEIEEAQKIMKDNKKEEEELTENPLDIQFRSLKLNRLEPMDRNSERFKLIETFTKNSHGKTHSSYGLEILEVFDLDREGEQDRFEASDFAKNENRRLLWHGSRMTNYVGILSQGLRIAPPEAPVTGYMFGKGVYFADCVSKSANYCYPNRHDNVGLMLLCEVALGDQLELIDADYYADQNCKKNQKLSTKGLGRTVPDPAGDIDIDNGVKLQLGKLVDSKVNGAYLQYNEMIVYDVSQIKMRYLVKMKFNY
ncbi:Poly [ADP-ribose] polymerase 2 [Actinomortierella wolfii]|nr:Poly [ADP-ribose] polymerase 2 [Actinomortierella wolfii]